MALFVIVQSVPINSESWPSILGEALEDLDLLWKSMEECLNYPGFPQRFPSISPYGRADAPLSNMVNSLGPTFQPQGS